RRSIRLGAEAFGLVQLLEGVPDSNRPISHFLRFNRDPGDGKVEFTAIMLPKVNMSGPIRSKATP
ncbi:MAG: VirK family protein, partial [Deltaproteobacteria bacterium]|nr:VirK family protein [Deltaproteobacteria bacterium]